MSPQKGIPAKSVPNEPGMSQPGPEAARPGLSSGKDYLRSAGSFAAVEYASSNAHRLGRLLAPHGDHA